MLLGFHGQQSTIGSKLSAARRNAEVLNPTYVPHCSAPAPEKILHGTAIAYLPAGPVLYWRNLIGRVSEHKVASQQLSPPFAHLSALQAAKAKGRRLRNTAGMCARPNTTSRQRQSKCRLYHLGIWNGQVPGPYVLTGNTLLRKHAVDSRRVKFLPTELAWTG